MSSKPHKPHRSPGWKRDVLLLTSILRLRVNPSLPYYLIADIALDHFYDPLLRYYTKSTTSTESEDRSPESKRKMALQFQETTTDEKDLKAWLASWLEQEYIHAETWFGECYLQAIGKDVSVVEEILDVCELWDQGFGLKDEAKWRLQVKWQREGDWKFWSEPFEDEEMRDWGVIGGQVMKCDTDKEGESAENLDSARVREEFEERQRIMTINEELIARLRNIEVSEPWVKGMGTTTIFAQQPHFPVQVQRLLPHPTQGNRDGRVKSTTLDPKTPVFQPFNWTPIQSPEPTLPSVNEFESTPNTFGSFIGQSLDVDSSPPPTMILESQSSEPLDPKKASLTVRLHSRWQGFSQQIDEIKAMEEMLKSKMGRKDEGNGSNGSGSRNESANGWIEMCMPCS